MFLDSPRTPTQPPCCGPTGWVITTVVSLIALAVASGTIGALVATVIQQQATIDEQCPSVAVPQSPGDCTICRQCYTCLGNYTGQDVNAVCMSSSTATDLQCTEQVHYLFNRPNPDQSIPCYTECQPCETCINTTRAIQQLDTDLNQTMWETVFPSLFVEPPATIIDDSTEDSDEDDDDSDDDSEGTTQGIGEDDDDIDEDSEGTTQGSDEDDDDDIDEDSEDTTQGSVEDDDDIDEDSGTNGTHVVTGRRRKRQSPFPIQPDGDSCCQTRRRYRPYLNEYIDYWGDLWYPVWFQRSYASPPALYQLYAEIECPLANPACTNSAFITCRQHAETRSFLMSRNPPHPVTGYQYIFLHYPGFDTRFIDVPIAIYCRCTQ